MKIIESIHGQYVSGRRICTLARHLGELIPPNASVLDVGCGDGALAALIGDSRPDLQLRGIDVLVRRDTAIPIEPFDGSHIPAGDRSVDIVMFADVLHHTDDPMTLLREARRVTRRHILIKDHLRDGLLAEATLRVMDGVGNARFGVSLPYHYWLRSQWDNAFGELGLRIEAWKPRLGIYPPWANWLFGRSLHFVARLGTGNHLP